jgi:hypothetical protein
MQVVCGTIVHFAAKDEIQKLEDMGKQMKVAICFVYDIMKTDN